VMAADERRNLEHLVLPEIGHLLLGDVRPSHVRAVLTGVSTKPTVRARRMSSRSATAPRRSPKCGASCTGSFARPRKKTRSSATR
jgi:hypothetical protein